MIVVSKMLKACLRPEAVSAWLTRILLQEFHQFVWFSHRQHAQHQRVNQTEDCRVSADAQRQRQNGNRCKARTAPHHPQRIAGVAPELFNHWDASSNTMY